jgi:hypothetical protein
MVCVCVGGGVIHVRHISTSETADQTLLYLVG